MCFGEKPKFGVFGISVVGMHLYSIQLQYSLALLQLCNPDKEEEEKEEAAKEAEEE